MVHPPRAARSSEQPHHWGPRAKVKYSLCSGQEQGRMAIRSACFYSGCSAEDTYVSRGENKDIPHRKTQETKRKAMHGLHWSKGIFVSDIVQCVEN